MVIPTLAEANQFLDEGERLNPGPWVEHSVYVARAAELIAAHLSGLDPIQAHIFGLLHDIGRSIYDLLPGVVENTFTARIL